MKRLACAIVSSICLMTASTGFALTAEDHDAFRAQSAEYSRADQELNAVWKRLRKELPKARYKEIQAEQRNWVGGLRDREALQHGGATAKGYALATQARVAYLRQVLAEARNAPQPAAAPAKPKAAAPAGTPAASPRPAPYPEPQPAPMPTAPTTGQSAPQSPAPVKTLPASSHRSAVSVTPVPAVAPVTHVELPAAEKPAPGKPQAPVISVSSSKATGGAGGSTNNGAEASGLIVQTASSKEIAPTAQQGAPGLQAPSPSLQQPAPQQPAPAAQQASPVAATEDIPPLQQAAPVKVITSNALDPEKEQSLRKSKKGKAKAAPKTRTFTGFPKEYQNAGLKNIRLDNAQGKPILQVGSWGNFSSSMQDCLQQALQSGTQVEVEGVTHAFSDGTIMMRADSPVTCRNK